MTNTQTFPAHFIGDLVRIVPSMRGKYGAQIFRVTAIPGGRRTKTVASPINGGQGVKADPWLFEKITDEEARAINAATPAVSAPSLVLGSVVTVDGKGAVRFVVIKLGADRVNVVKLGGDGNRYFRVSPMLLSVVEV